VKARKGDLVLVERTDRTYAIGKDNTARTTYHYGVVHSASRDGVVKTWSALGYGDDMVSDVGQKVSHRETVRVMPRAEVDVDAVLHAAKAHHWPGHPGQPMPFDSFDEARDVARPHATAKDGAR
jgi:hypothetical protein